MSERFERIYALPEALYALGAPVIVSQGFLLKDHEKENLLAQLKLKSISAKTIKNVKVQLTPLDEENQPLAGAMMFAYSNLAVARDEAFGQKSAVIVNAAEAKAFSVRVVEVAFDDDSLWADRETEWTALPAQKDLLSLLQGDEELVKQYQAEYTDAAIFQPVIDRDLWLCTCGAVNARDELACHVCGCTLDALSHVNFRELNEKKEQRLLAEAAADGEAPAEDAAEAAPEENLSKKEKKQAKKAAKKAAKNKDQADESGPDAEEPIEKPKKKKKGSRVFVILLLIAALAVGGYFGYGYYMRESAYQSALTLANSGDYEQAITAFEKLADYKDVEEQIQNVKYLQAVSYVEQSRYEEAIAQFKSLGAYKDCPNQIQRAQYLLANVQVNNGHYKEAIALYRELGEYEDSAEQIALLYKQAVNYIKEEKFDTAIEIFTALGEYQKSPGLLLCTIVGQKMATAMSSVTQEELNAMPADYAYTKKLLAHYKNYEALKDYVGTFTCTEQTNTKENSANKKGHTLVSDFQLANGRLLWLFSDDASNPTRNISDDFKPVDNYNFFSRNRAVVKDRVVDTYAPAGQTIATATISFADGSIVYRSISKLTDASETTETLTFTAAAPAAEETPVADTTTTEATSTTNG